MRPLCLLWREFSCQTLTRPSPIPTALQMISQFILLKSSDPTQGKAYKTHTVEWLPRQLCPLSHQFCPVITHLSMFAPSRPTFKCLTGFLPVSQPPRRRRDRCYEQSQKNNLMMEKQTGVALAHDSFRPPLEYAFHWINLPRLLPLTWEFAHCFFMPS